MEMFTFRMASDMKIARNTPNISHWSMDNGYDDGFHENEYPYRATIMNNIGSGTLSIINLNTSALDFESHCNGADQGFKLTITAPGDLIKVSRNYFRMHFSKWHKLTITSKLFKTSNGLRKYSPNRRKCFFNSENPLRFFKIYTQSNCEEECLANFTKTECECVEFYMPSRS